jgi:hypothetical protein
LLPPVEVCTASAVAREIAGWSPVAVTFRTVES